MLRAPALSLLLLTIACGEGDRPPVESARKAQTKVSETPSAPRQPGGLPADGTPLSEEPATPGAGQEAATVLEAYYALIEAGNYEEAWKLRATKRGGSSAAFVSSFGKYASYRADVGVPSEPQEANGSFYVEVPVQIYVRLKSGEPFSSAGSVTLRRKKNEREWRIHS